MKTADLIALFRRESDDRVKNPYLWDDPDVVEYLAEAEREAAQRANLIRDTEEFPVKAGDTTIDIGALVYDIQYAELCMADGTFVRISPTSRDTLDAERPGWRRKTDRPSGYIHDDKTLLFDAIVSEDCTLYIEYFRFPKKPLKDDSDIPEIAEAHHEHLVDWALHRAFGRPDADGFDPARSAAANDRFTAYFGKPKNADLRRRQNKDRPHRNRVHP